MSARALDKGAGSATRRKLVEAAEELFSEQGFEKVSVRDVTERAEANVAAVNYHFGSREALVEQVIARYINPVNEERIARLDTLERRAGSRAIALEELLDAFVRPFATQVRRSELSERLFYKLMGRIFGTQASMLPESVERGFEKMLKRYRKAFAKALPELDEEELVWRIHFTVGAMVHTMAHGATLFRFTEGASGQPSMESTLSRFIHYAAAGMRQGGGGTSAAAEPNEEFLF